MQCCTCKYLLQRLSLFAFAAANFSIITSKTDNTNVSNAVVDIRI